MMTNMNIEEFAVRPDEYHPMRLTCILPYIKAEKEHMQLIPENELDRFSRF